MLALHLKCTVFHKPLLYMYSFKWPHNILNNAEYYFPDEKKACFIISKKKKFSFHITNAKNLGSLFHVAFSFLSLDIVY